MPTTPRASGPARHRRNHRIGRTAACPAVAGMLAGAVELTLPQRDSTQNGPDTANPRERTFAGQSAWQLDPKLGHKWRLITGRFIFQRACLACHEQGPASFTHAQRKAKLQHFPDPQHRELLPKTFADLTAMFAYGKIMPGEQARVEALETFLLDQTPQEPARIPDRRPKAPVDLLPAVGCKASDFAIADTSGRKQTLNRLIANGHALILVFSRAHW